MRRQGQQETAGLAAAAGPEGTGPARPSEAGVRPPPVTVPGEAQRHGYRSRKRPLPPLRPADLPHLDLPTPLSPMMRIFRVVSTSSSILTPSPAGRPCFASQACPRQNSSRMRSVPRLPPSFCPGCLGYRSPGLQSSARRKLCVCAHQRPGRLSRKRVPPVRKRRQGRAALTVPQP